MKIIIAVALTVMVFAALHIPITRKRKGVVLTVYALAMTLLFVVYNIRTISNIVTFRHPTNQSIYQPAYLKGGEYPDAFLDSFFEGKTVYTPDDAHEDPVKSFEDGSYYTHDGEPHYWLYYYYHAVDMWNYLDLCRAKVVKDPSLNDIKLNKAQKAYFQNLGPANDMMRYTFPLNSNDGEVGNGFYYFWFYNSYIIDSNVYICPENIKDADELVVIWQNLLDSDSYYIASKEYFDTVIAK